jgi:ferredoxin
MDSILATVLLGPGYGPAAFILAGLVTVIFNLKYSVLRHPFLLGALIGHLAEFGASYPEIQVNALGRLWLLFLIPVAPVALLTGRQRWKSFLAPWPVWLLTAFLKLYPGSAPLAWSFWPVWLTLASQLGSQFWPTRRVFPGGLFITLAGLAPVFGPLHLLPALALLMAVEINLSLKRFREAKKYTLKKWPHKYVENPDLVAVRLCRRQEMTMTSVYQGPPGCRLAAALDGGPLLCFEGCLGLGDCQRSCPFGALKPLGPGLPPKLDKARCRGCGACLSACPKGLMVLRPREATFVVACRGSAKLKDMDRLCPFGCLKCGRCRKACPVGAIDRLGPLAPPPVSDEICLKSRPDCGLACRSACPRQLPVPSMGKL